MRNTYIKEISIWILSILVSALIWYPIYSKISYKYLFHGILAITMMIQFFRWFVFYDHVILFHKKRYILLSIFLFFSIGMVTWSKGQSIQLDLENQTISDIVYQGSKIPNLGLLESYNLFEYIRTLLILCNFGTLGLAIVLIVKIVYKTVGMGNTKVRSYLGN